MKLLLLLALGVTLAACASSVPKTTARPPVTRAEPVTDLFHGAAVIDPYRWLEGAPGPEPTPVPPDIAAWTDAQNAYTRQVIDALPGRAAIEARLRTLIEVGTVTAPAIRRNRYFFAKREGAQEQPVIYWREGSTGETRVLIDPVTIDATGLTTVEWTSASHDGTLVAYGTYRSGDENTTLHVLNVDTGATLPFEIPDKTQAPDWLPDGSGFVYQNLKNAKDPYSGQVLFHRMGTDRAKDVVLFRQFTKDENETLATTWGPFGSLSRDGRWLVLGYWVDTKSNDLWIVDFDRFRRTGRVEKTVVSVGEPGLAFGTVIDGTLYLQTTKGAPKGRVVAVDVAKPASANWRDVVPERADSVIESVSFAKGAVAVTYLRNASNAIEVFNLAGTPVGAVKLPGIGAAAIRTELDRTEAYVTFTSFNYPTTIFRVDVAKPDAEPELWERPAVPIDPATVEVEQVWYRSKDGTNISMFLVHRTGLVKDGRTPTILSGYGGFNVSETPAFVSTLFQWFEAGGIYALPNLRGGGEYGDAWHEAGMLEKKQNVFDDFIAAAEWLIAEDYTNPSTLAISGGSNGGLLTGAAITQRPDLFRAAIVAVPLLDMLRYQEFLMAKYWVPEYGAATEPEQFRFLHEYSPYHRVKSGTKYPAVLLTAGEHDRRVHAMHARKMAARLQSATTADPAEQPVLLWVDREAGHGQGKPLRLRLQEATDMRTFVMWQLGMLK